MGTVPKTSTIEHFSQGNPSGPGQSNVPALLRRVAETLQELGAVQVQDVVFHSDVTEEGDDFPSLSVYFYREPSDSEGSSAVSDISSARSSRAR